MTTPKQPERRSAETPFTDAGLALPTTLGEFWAWSSSDLLSNALRGQLAEFIVGTALGCLKNTAIRTEWDAYDLVTTSGVRIEVKSTAYLQSWGPTAPASLRFSIAERYAWDARTNSSATERSRSADVYVFCVHTETSPPERRPTGVEAVGVLRRADRRTQRGVPGSEDHRPVGPALTYRSAIGGLYRTRRCGPHRSALTDQDLISAPRPARRRPG